MTNVQLPDGLAAQAVWLRQTDASATGSGAADRYGVVLVSETARRRQGLWLTIAGITFPIVVFLVGLPWYVAVPGPLIAVGGVFYGLGGAGGYYELRPDGSLGERFGRRPPSGMSGMRAHKPR